MPKLWKTQAEDPPLYIDLVQRPGLNIQLCILDSEGFTVPGGILMEILPDGSAELIGRVDKQAADRAGIMLDGTLSHRLKVMNTPR